MARISPEREVTTVRRRRFYVKPIGLHDEDWNRMVWATFKPFALIFASTTIMLLMVNLILYQQKWSNGYSPEECIKFRTCLKKKNSSEALEILVPMLRNNSLGPVVHHFLVVSVLCSTTIAGNVLNDFSLIYYPTYALSAVWTHEHYHNFRIILDSTAILYNLAHLTHLLVVITGFAFAATVIDKKYRKVSNEMVITETKIYNTTPSLPVPD